MALKNFSFARYKMRQSLHTLAVLVVLTTLPVCAFAHPELMLQIEDLSAQIETDPANADLLVKRGDLYRRHQDYPAAGEDFAEARNVDPDNSLLNFYEGRLLLDTGNSASARHHFSRYLEIYPEHSNAWVLLGEACIQSGDSRRAADYFEQAINTSDTPSPALYRSQVLSLMASGDAPWDSASQVVKKGLDHFGLEVNLLGLGTDIALAANQKKQADRYLQRLPAPLQALPQWEKRQQMADCLASPENETQSKCLRQARENITTQVELFMKNESEPRQGILKDNVSYKSVTELDFRQADKRLVYGDANPELQYGLLWLPENSNPVQKAPLVVLIHGGCWLNAFDIQHSQPLSSALADAGYAVWSLEYRRSGDAGGAWPGSYDDVKQGLAFISSLKDYPVDLDRVVLMGHSAGGHLALLAASETEGVSGVIGLAAITDIIEYSRGENSCQTATLEFMSGPYESNPEAYRAANPTGKAVHERTILLQGDADTIVPPGQSTLAGASEEMLAGTGHFDWVHPGTSAYQLLLSTLTDLFAETD
jgi:acetyl esterase/lipase/Tfp pilus assembly protein PilF